MERREEYSDCSWMTTQRVPRTLPRDMLVAKRFFRNRLAIVGLVIIVCMFLFAFVGGAVNPYSQSEVFYRTEEMKKDYAGAAKIDEFQVFVGGRRGASELRRSPEIDPGRDEKCRWIVRDQRRSRHWHCWQNVGRTLTHIYAAEQAVAIRTGLKGKIFL